MGYYQAFIKHYESIFVQIYKISLNNSLLSKINDLPIEDQVYNWLVDFLFLMSTHYQSQGRMLIQFQHKL